MLVSFAFLQHPLSIYLFRLCRIRLSRPFHHGDDGPDVRTRTKNLLRIVVQSFRLHRSSRKLAHLTLNHYFLFIKQNDAAFCQHKVVYCYLLFVVLLSAVISILIRITLDLTYYIK